MLAIAAASSHAAVTIGSNLAGDPEATINSPGDDPCTLGQALPGSSRAVGGATAPNSGVVVRWRIKVGIGATDIFVSPTALRVLRAAGSGTWTGAGTSSVRTPAPDTMSTFATRLPIRAGDELGVDCCGEASQYFANTVGAQSPNWLPRLADGETRATTTSPGCPRSSTAFTLSSANTGTRATTTRPFVIHGYPVDGRRPSEGPAGKVRGPSTMTRTVRAARLLPRLCV